MIDSNAIDGVDTTLIDGNILKFIPHKGTKFSQLHIDQLSDLIENNFTSKLAYLVDTINMYDFTYEAMKGFSSYDKLVGIAYIARESEKHDRVRYLNVFPLRKNHEVEMKSFDNEEDAISWLKTKLEV